jgi:hypothetical protein
MRTTLLIILVVAFSVVTGCQAATPSPGTTVTPSPTPSPEALALMTQAPAPANQACMEALAVGELALNPRTGLGIVAGSDVIPVVWPNGYTASVVETTLVLFGPDGTPLARLGDQVELGGGFGGDGLWYPCHGQLSVVGR